MTNGRIRENVEITLRSDLCVGSGFSYAGIIDSEVMFDPYGFPYISGKRLKGCMREAAELIGEKDIEGIFGKQYASEYETIDGGITLSDAYPKDMPKYSLLQKVTSNQKYKDYFEQEKIRNLYTSIRSQTRIDENTGTAEDNTLRFTRVINRSSFIDNNPMIFVAEIIYPEGKRDSIERILKATRNIGMDRNRGLGSVKISLFPKDKAYGSEMDEPAFLPVDDKKSEGASRIRISYVVRNKGPLMISSDNDMESIDYIPGSAVLGAFAKEYLRNKKDDDNRESGDDQNEMDPIFKDLFLNGKTIFSDLNLCSVDGSKIAKDIFYLSPSYINRLKKTNKLVDTEVLAKTDKESLQDKEEYKEYNTENANQPKKLKGKRISYCDDGYKISEVKKEIVYHHTKKSNKEESTDGDMLYFFDAVSKDQYFSGSVIVDKKYKDKILPCLQKGRLYFGKSKSAQYGLCKVESIIIEPYKPVRHEVKDTKQGVLLVNLLSDAVFMDEDGNYISDYHEIWKMIRREINADEKDPHQSYINIKVLNGYSGIWNLHKQEIPVVAAGSTFAFKVSNNPIFPDFLGMKNNEGFGNYEVTVHPNDFRLKKAGDSADNADEIEMIKKDAVLSTIYKKSLIDCIFSKCKARAFNKSKMGITASALGRVNLMAIEAWNENKKMNSDICSIEAYCSLVNRVNSIKKESTRKNVKEYMRTLFNEFPDCKINKKTDELVQIKNDDIKQDEVIKGIIGEPDQDNSVYIELINLVGEDKARIEVFNLWYPLLIEILTYQKYLLKD